MLLDYNKNEEWRDIQGYEGLYQVSNQARVRSLVKNKCKILSPTIDSVGRKYKHIRYNLKRKKVYIHILVAKAFPEICGKWFDDCDVHHKDFNVENNTPNNLIVLSKEEHKQIHLETKIEKSIGENNPFYNKHHTDKTKETISNKNSIPILQYTLDGLFVREWKNMIDAANNHNVCISAICNCLKGKSKKSAGYIWKYKK